MFRKTMLGGALVLGLLLAAAFGFSAFAEEDASDTRADKMKEAYQTFITKLAENLNIDESELEAALEETQEDILAEQVENGVITQEQADKMSERGFNFGCISGRGGPPPDGQKGPGGPCGPGGHGGPERQDDAFSSSSGS